MAKTTSPLFRAPMLATATTTLPVGKWVAEEKLDGHRLIVAVDTVLEKGAVTPYVQAWSRTGNARALPSHLYQVLKMLPLGIYDGELIVPGGTSSDVADLGKQSKLRYVIFDILATKNLDLTSSPWTQRRSVLELACKNLPGFFVQPESFVQLMPYRPVLCWADVEQYVDEIWDQGGEGAILKDMMAPYRVGKRTKTFLKVKQCIATAAADKPLTIIGFASSQGEVNNYGQFGTAVLRDDEGVVVPVKILDDEVRARLVKAIEGRTLRVEWHEVRLLSNKKVKYWTGHPWVGRKLHIEYQSRTADGSYRHPRWDRLDGE